jgi:hypothetical protein
MIDGSNRRESPPHTMSGDGLPCARCGHPVELVDRLCSIVLRGLTYGFHASCYDAWRVDTPAPPWRALRE